MKEKRINTYLQALKHALWMRGLYDAGELAEIESHLRESVEQGLEQGLSAEEAEQAALQRFGSVKIISATFERERMEPLQKILLVLGVLAGVFLAYVDALPKWDDTGILAGGLFLVSGLLALAGYRRPWLLALAVGLWIPLHVSGLLTLLGYRRPWLLALAIGLWIPLHDIYLTHDFRMLLVLIFPFAGAYLGWAVHLGLRKMLHPA